jgi:hypothetical protein
MFAFMSRSAASLESFPKLKDFLKMEIASVMVPATSRRTENRRLSAGLSSYHDGALPSGNVQNSLSQTQRFQRRFDILIDADALDRALETRARRRFR